MPVKPIPDGYHTVTPYLIIPNAADFIDFAVKALGAMERVRALTPEGKVMHAEVQVGDSVIMLGDANDEFASRPAMLHLYVPDCDAAYKHALDAGCESVREPADQAYGDRSAGVNDRFGNQWWFATHVAVPVPA